MITNVLPRFYETQCISEIIAKDTVSEMQRTVDALIEWSKVN